jgi:hypothetical protein
VCIGDTLYIIPLTGFKDWEKHPIPTTSFQWVLQKAKVQPNVQSAVSKTLAVQSVVITPVSRTHRAAIVAWH